MSTTSKTMRVRLYMLVSFIIPTAVLVPPLVIQKGKFLVAAALIAWLVIAVSIWVSFLLSLIFEYVSTPTPSCTSSDATNEPQQSPPTTPTDHDCF